MQQPQSSSAERSPSMDPNAILIQQNTFIVTLIRQSEATLRQAQRQHQQSSEKLKKLDRAASKLIIAQKELWGQAQACQGMVDEMKVGCQQMDQTSDTLTKDYQQKQAALQNILDELALRTVVPALAGSLIPPTSPLHNSGVLHRSGLVETSPNSDLNDSTLIPQQPSLFDFVDGESIRSLQAAYLQGMTSLYQLSEQTRNTLLQPSQLQLNEVRKLEEDLREKMGNDDNSTSNSASSVAPASSVLSQANNAFTALETDVNEMGRLFSELCSAYDRVRQIHLTKAAAAQSSPQGETDLSTSHQEVTPELEQMQSMERQMQLLSQRVTTLAQELESASGAHATLYTQTLQLFNTLSTFGPSLKTTLASFHACQLEHSTLVSSVQSHINELHNLSLWYQQFERSYNQLLEEIQRRHRQMHHLQSFISSVQQQLNDIHQEEVKERESFYHQFGRYLPPTLCPAIAEETIQVKIVPETLTTELPVYIPTTEEQELAAKLAHQQPQTRSTSSDQPLSTSPPQQPQPPTSQTSTGPQSLSGSNQSMAHSSTNGSVNISPAPTQPTITSSVDYTANIEQLQASGHIPAPLHEILGSSHRLSSSTKLLEPLESSHPTHTPSPPPHIQMQQFLRHQEQQEQQRRQQQLQEQQEQERLQSTINYSDLNPSLISPTPLQHQTAYHNSAHSSPQYSPHAQQHHPQYLPQSMTQPVPNYQQVEPVSVKITPTISATTAANNYPARARGSSFIQPIAPRGFGDDD